MRIERKRMIAGRTALDEALRDEVGRQAKPGHGDSINKYFSD